MYHYLVKIGNLFFCGFDPNEHTPVFEFQAFGRPVLSRNPADAVAAGTGADDAESYVELLNRAYPSGPNAPEVKVVYMSDEEMIAHQVMSL